MQQLLKTILLVEDCEADIYLHSRVIKHVAASSQLLVARTGDQALQLLLSNYREGIPPPELIFLDINTPGMEAWEFVRRFSNLDEGARSGARIIMLSGSLNPDDRARADALPLLHEYRQKPLSREAMSEILLQYFAPRPS